MKIIHLTGHISPYYSFGLGAVAVNLAKYQRELGCDSEIWCIDSSEGINDACLEYGFPLECVKSFRFIGPKNFLYSPDMELFMKNGGGYSFDVLHQHGIWTLLSRVSNIWSDKYGKIKVIAPHGSLHHIALKKSTIKKKLACFLYENKNFSTASFFHATSLSEMDDFRDFGLKNRIELILNGVSLKQETAPCTNDFREKFFIDRKKRIVLYLSRITPKKGIPMLLRSIAALEKEISDWHFIVAGSDEGNHKKDIEALISQLGLNKMVTILGPLYGKEKMNAFAESDIFILPSYSEGSPMIVLEALASGLPVITTKASPWKDLVTHDCGWWCDISEDGVTNSLRAAMSLSKKELVARGSNGVNLVKNRYSWKDVAKQTVSLYHDCIQRKP